MSQMRSGVSPGPYTVKISENFQVSVGSRAVDRIDIASLCGLTTGPCIKLTPSNVRTSLVNFFCRELLRGSDRVTLICLEKHI